jgi:hypothetical protein
MDYTRRDVGQLEPAECAEELQQMERSGSRPSYVAADPDPKPERVLDYSLSPFPSIANLTAIRLPGQSAPAFTCAPNPYIPQSSSIHGCAVTHVIVTVEYISRTRALFRPARAVVA